MKRFGRRWRQAAKAKPIPASPEPAESIASVAPSGAAQNLMEDRKPRVLIAGEFSAGKTQLINGLLRRTVLPSNVTATALPPVWLVGDPRDALAQVDLGKKMHRIDALHEAGVEDTFFCLRSAPAAVLERYDLIDTPGNSDPNIPPESWERMLAYADTVVWCTNATQAWRQSEKAVWEEMPDHLVGNATLLVTHADRIIDARSAERVLRRVKREAGKYFSSFLMVSLIKQSDIDLIEGHLDGIVAGLEARRGEVSVRMRNFLKDTAAYALAAEEPAPVQAPEPEPAQVKPRRMREARPAAAQTDFEAMVAASATSTAVSALMATALDVPDAPKAEVIDLARAGAAKGGAIPATGRAGALWQALVRDVDTDDPSAILACVDRLIATLDDPNFDDNQLPIQPDSADDDSPMARTMIRRTS